MYVKYGFENWSEGGRKTYRGRAVLSHEARKSERKKLVFDYRRNRSHDGLHNLVRNAAKPVHESLRINAAQLQRIDCREFRQAIGAVGNDLEVPKILRKILFPFRQRRDQFDRKIPMASELTTSTGRALRISAPTVGSRLTCQISPRLIFIAKIPCLPGLALVRGLFVMFLQLLRLLRQNNSPLTQRQT